MKRSLSATRLFILITLNTIHISTLQAKGFFETLSDFFTNLTEDIQPQTNTKYTLSRKQAENYIDLYIASLGNALRPNACEYDIQKIKEKAYTAFNQSSNVFIWVSGIRMYNKDMIDQFLLSAIIEVVESNTYVYTYNQTHNTSTASKIAQIMRTRLMSLITNNSTIDPYRLKPFFGYQLNQTILNEIATLTSSYNYMENAYQPYGSTGYTGYGYTGRTGSTGGYYSGTYPSRSCCICFDEFGGATERLFLKPCGHDMCKMCALDYFFPNNLPDQTKKCPMCRGWVDLEELYNDVL
jgi:hypothetical protein